MAQAPVLEGRFPRPTSVSARQEAHLRILRASWAAANGLPGSGGDARGATDATIAGTTVVWSSRPPRGAGAAVPSAPVASAFHPAPSTTTDGSMSLTRRGRFLLIGMPIALGIIALILVGAFLTSQAQAGEGTPVSTVTIEVSVMQGETLWDIAVLHSPERDPRVVVAEMVELNDLHTSLVRAGQRLVVPAGQ